jgi:phosphoribosylformylglycinamidine synthase
MVQRDESFDPVPVSVLDDAALREHLQRCGLTLSVEEARRVAGRLDRDPTLAEMTLFDTMWSEHCSYKSSRARLKRHLPTAASNVVIGPVEDAGVVDFGEIAGRRYGIVIAHESHNHPSQVMPVEGAATGIGGIVRDVYCMGAEVIGCLDPLRFGWPTPLAEEDGENGEAAAERRREIAREVVAGIWQYANAIGVPNLGGDVVFHPSFNENCLVNVVAVGVVAVDRILHSAVPPAAAEEPYDLVLVGKPTDWSGMGGAAFASATLDAAAATENKGSVQTPDPFLKRILTVANRAVLALAEREEAALGFKDLGAGGVSCVTSEMCDAGGFGCDVDLALVHAADDDVPARVIACSETQERYGLAVPARLTARVLQIYNEDYALPTLYDGACARRIGAVTRERRFVLRCGDRMLAEAPIEAITRGISYDRTSEAPAAVAVAADERLAEGPVDRIADEWLGVMGHPNVASREWIFRHYDSEVQGNTILRPGEADAGVVAPVAGSRRAVALAADGNPRLGLADPWTAGAAAVLEACRNVACVGGEPAAVTDCLNFGNPELPKHFWQFTEAVRGVGDACRELRRLSAPEEPLPVVSGNVSFYNQSASGRAVAPSPIVACVGIVEDYARSRSQRFKSPGDAVYLLGRRTPELGASLYLEAGFTAGRPAVPPLDFAQARAEIAAVVGVVRDGLATAVHDVSDGGLAVCLAEMAVGLEGQRLLGARLSLPADWSGLSLREALFGEVGGFVLTCAAERCEAIERRFTREGAAWWRVGEVTVVPELVVAHPARDERVAVPVASLARVWQTGLPRLLGGEEAAGVVPAPAARAPAVDENERPAPSRSFATAPALASQRGPHIAVLQLPGVNCEDESARALDGLGARAEIFRWTRPTAELRAFDGYLIPGGFSYQDRVRAGAIAAKDPLLEVIAAAAASGKPILGICNGCQVLVEAGLVPGREADRVEIALAPNRFPGRRGYHARWVNLAAVAGAASPFVADWPGPLPIPVAHAEGRFTHEDPEFFAKLLAAGHVALRYVGLDGEPGGNPNGSLLDCAGLTNGRGNVLALMPHPERAALLRTVPEDLPHSWGVRRLVAADDPELLEGPGPGAHLLARLVALC